MTDNSKNNLKIGVRSTVPEAANSPTSPSPRMKKHLFLTQKRLSSEGELFEYHSKLNLCIDDLDEKVKDIVEKHEAQFMYAYRNHVKRVREEMDEIKKKSLSNVNSSVGQIDKIQTLEKELIIFREESLKLFEKLTMKDRVIEKLTIKIAELEKQTTFLSESVKNFTKRNKYLEGICARIKQQPSHKGIQLSSTRLVQPLNNGQTFSRTASKLKEARSYTTSFRTKNVTQHNDKHSQALERLKNKLGEEHEETIRAVLSELPNLFLSSPSVTLNPQWEKMNRTGFPTKRPTVSRNSIGSAIREQSKADFESKQLQKVFRNCIEEVKKEISRRREINTINFYKQNGSISFEDFKKIDHFRLIELLLSKDDVLKGFHQLLFAK